MSKEIQRSKEELRKRDDHCWHVKWMDLHATRHTRHTRHTGTCRNCTLNAITAGRGLFCGVQNCCGKFCKTIKFCEVQKTVRIYSELYTGAFCLNFAFKFGRILPSASISRRFSSPIYRTSSFERHLVGVCSRYHSRWLPYLVSGVSLFLSRSEPWALIGPPKIPWEVFL